MAWNAGMSFTTMGSDAAIPGKRPFSMKVSSCMPGTSKKEGADHIMSWMQDCGLNTMCLATTYHSGWFIHPHSSRHRAYWSEGGVAYFHPDESLYVDTPIRPAVSSCAEYTDRLKVVGERLHNYNLRLVSWTVGVHNTRLGQLFPDFAQQNVFGDVLPHALSIGHDATRQYLKALCRDLVVNYPIHGLLLESFGWMGLRHGHHHERDLAGLSSFEQDLMSICFNPETVRKAQVLGIDVGKVREVVRGTLEAAFEHAPDRPKNHPLSIAEMEYRSEDLRAYIRFCKELADSLISEIKRESLRGTNCELYVQSGYNSEIADVCDAFAVWVYGQSPDKAFDTVSQKRAEFPAQ